MASLLMHKATAVWLIDNTALTFEQIAEFCELHLMEVQAIADGTVASSIVGDNPILKGQLTDEEIKRCEADPKASLKLAEKVRMYQSMQKKSKSRYTPVARRQDKPDAIAWFLRYYPDLPDAKIVKLIGTTKKTIASIRERSHWNIANIKPKDPVLLGLCKQTELDKVVAKTAKAEDPKPEHGPLDDQPFIEQEGQN